LHQKALRVLQIAMPIWIKDKLFQKSTLVKELEANIWA
jgi:hypothetical protein